MNQTSENSGNKSKMVRVSLGGEDRVVERSQAMTAANELHEKFGGVPKFEDVADATDDVAPDPLAGHFKSAEELGDKVGARIEDDKKDMKVSALLRAQAAGISIDPSHLDKVADSDRAAAPATGDVVIDGVSTEGKVRSMLNLQAAEASGFAPRAPIYERGRLVNSIGVANARRSRMEHDAKPFVTAYCEDFHARIKSEERRDILVPAHTLRMTGKGQLGVPRPKEVPVGVEHIKQVWALTEPALQAISTRLGLKGSAYLQQCWPALRQYNFNEWLKRIHLAHDEACVQARLENESEPEPQELALRLRKCLSGGEEVYGVVTEKYTAFDVDLIAKAIQEATPKDARGTVTYDGYKARFEIMFHSNVQPEKYTAGEFFKCGVTIRTDDTGGGSITGNAVIWQNLCLNLIIIDQAKQDLFRIRHMGDLEKLIARFREGFAQALSKLDHFTKAWGYAVEDDVVAAARAVDSEVPMKVSEAMPGLFNGILERELVPVRGRREENVKSLMKMWEEDTSAAAGPTRAAVANAFTRFAHMVNQDPWAEDEIQRAAGPLIYSRKPLPYLALDVSKAKKP